MRNYRLIQVIRDVCLVLVPIIIAAALAYQVSLHDQRNRAQTMADVVLNRSELTTQQLASAFQRMEVFGPARACSPEAMALMRAIDLGSSLLQGVGYVENNELKCSSLGEVGPVDVGPPDFVSAKGGIIRRHRVLPIAPGTPLLLVSADSGYTALVHPALIFNLADEHGDLPAGTVGYSTRQTILYSGSKTYDWRSADMPANQYSGTLVMDDHILAWRRADVWDQFTYAAIPVAAVGAEFWGLVGFYLAGGLVAGCAALWMARWLTATRTSLPALLRAGLANNEIQTVYQPIVDMRTGRWVGAEVLARWRRQSGESISPDVFVPIAEKHGLIRQLTRHVMITAANDLEVFLDLSPDFFVSINITSMDLQDPDFEKRLVAECDARGVAHRRVHLEITERAEVDPAKEAQTIRILREHGFEVGIDDFGIGYSNLVYLDTLNVDYLKIDKAFVASLSGGTLGTAVVDHIIGLAGARGLSVIAEGVEQEEQRAALVTRGVWLGQGWLFAKPMSAANLVLGYGEMRQFAEPQARTLVRVA
jgi:sensor c-di-GMP phosphodiesterase-like protein